MRDLWFKHLDLKGLFEKDPNPVWKRFRKEASKISNHRYSSDQPPHEVLDRIICNLSFEDHFKLLSQFISGEELSLQLKKV